MHVNGKIPPLNEILPKRTKDLFLAKTFLTFI